MKTVVEISAALDVAYSEYSNAILNVFESNETLIEWDRKVAQERSRILMENDPKALGANEAIRNAKVTEMLGDLMGGYLEVEQQARLAKHCLEIARVDVEGSRAQLRCLELAGTTQVATQAQTVDAQSKRTSRRKKADSDTPPDSTPIENTKGDILDLLMDELNQLPKPPLTMSVEQLARYSQLITQIKEIRPGWSDPIYDDIAKVNAQPSPEEKSEPTPLGDLSAMTDNEIGIAICATPLPPSQMTPADVERYWSLVNERKRRTPEYEDIYEERVARDFPIHFPNLKTMPDGELIEKEKQLKATTAPDNRAAYLEINAELVRRFPKWNEWETPGIKIAPAMTEAPAPSPTPEPIATDTPAIAEAVPVEDLGDGINF